MTLSNECEHFVYISVVAICAAVLGSTAGQGYYSICLDKDVAAALLPPARASAALHVLYFYYPECRSDFFDIRFTDDANSVIQPDPNWVPEPGQVPGTAGRLSDQPDHTPLFTLAD